MSYANWAGAEPQPPLPKEIKQLHDLASLGERAYAARNHGLTCGVFCHHDGGRGRWAAEWRVSDNSDRGWGAIIYQPSEGKWLFRNGILSDKDQPLADFKQAVLLAVRMFQTQIIPDCMAETFKQPLTADEVHALITQGAKQHGEDDDPDHEVGDLQDALKVALEHMSPDQRAKLMVDETVLRVINGGLDAEA